jgi:Protein kinase domain
LLQFADGTPGVECRVTREREPENATAAPTRLPTQQPDGERLEPGRPLSEHGPLDDARFAPGHIFASRYRIVSLLGRGAMGEVYRAEDLKLGQPVAIKLLAVSGARSRRVERCIREVRLARTIAHPNVCRVYDIGEADGWWHLSMELVDGETLQSLLRRIGRLADEKALDMTRQLCAGLAAAHDRGVVHRDLKPSNIMVDGRGRVRIMDFGLAVPSGEWTIGEVAGTPAYMPPEQIDGDAATERSDVYALGLLIYELHAGRQLFPARTLDERRTSRPDVSVALASVEMNPEIERLVRSCLEDDPAHRPSSALAVAARLPGGDPLAAAIAGGVLPSPEMVAAAGPKGALRPITAWAMLLAIMIGILAVASQAHVANIAASDVPKSPEALAERARTVLAGVGVQDIGVDHAYWFEFDPAREDGRKNLRFVFRQSPIYLVPQNLFHLVTAVDPPDNVPGMATVTLDPLGRLLGFTRLPPATAPLATSVPVTDWTAVFREAGLDASAFAPAEPGHSPQVPHDTRLAWTQTSAGNGLRVTAATLDGNPVQFGITKGGAGSTPAFDPPLSTGSRRADLALWTLILALFPVSAVLARYNLRLGLGDRQGARKLAGFGVSLGVASVILRPHHVPAALEEITYLFAATGWALAWGGITWLMYMSLEPYLRRLWPRTLISWNRLLAGHVRDPLVGRDVLIGMLAGLIQLVLVLVPISVGATSAYSNVTLDSNAHLESLQSVQRFLNVLLPFQVVYSLMGGLATVFLLVVARLIVRKTWIAAGVVMLLAIPFSPASLGWPLIFVMATALVGIAVFLRVGVLALVAGGAFPVGVLLRVPVTLDPAAWYFGHSLVVLLILGALAVYGFLVSLGGRPAFGGSPA